MVEDLGVKRYSEREALGVWRGNEEAQIALLHNEAYGQFHENRDEVKINNIFLFSL